MKNKKVVVFVIINIILIGIICSLISIKKNLIKEKQVLKEMSESTQISDLQNQINQLNASQEEYAKNIQSYKAKLATAITSQKVTTSENATIDEMVTNIGNILQARTKDATATADNITAGKTAWVNGKLITGNGADNNSYYDQGVLDSKGDFIKVNNGSLEIGKTYLAVISTGGWYDECKLNCNYTVFIAAPALRILKFKAVSSSVIITNIGTGSINAQTIVTIE